MTEYAHLWQFNRKRKHQHLHYKEFERCLRSWSISPVEEHLRWQHLDDECMIVDSTQLSNKARMMGHWILIKMAVGEKCQLLYVD